MAVSNPFLFQLANLKIAVKSSSASKRLFMKSASHLNNVCSYSTAVNTAETVDNQSVDKPPERKMSKAMMAYLERATAHDAFIKREKEDFIIGKRHLANIMGENPEHFNQQDIDRAIEYLLPSGLFDKAARPLMKPPEEIFPPRKAAEFDVTGRPFHSLFYTTAPNYYQMLYDMVEEMEKLNKLEDEMISKGILPKQPMDLSSSEWISNKELEKKLLEPVEERLYEYFISTAERLAEHPLSNQSKDFIMNYRKKKILLTQSFEIPPLEYDANGRPFITVKDCMRKSARGSVTVKGKGTGKITVNGKQLIQHFEDAQHREQVVFPLHFTGFLDTVDVEAHVQFGGPTGHAGCIRWGIAWALRSFVDKNMLEKMRVAGLLTRDWRRRERKKPGQEGARRKFTWKAR